MEATKNVEHVTELDKLELSDTSTLQAEIEKLGKLIWKKNQAKANIAQLLTERKWDLDYKLPKLRSLRFYRRYYWQPPGSRIQLLQQAIATQASHTDKSKKIKNLCNRVQHGCNSLKEERRIFKEIQQAEEDQVSEADLNMVQGLGPVTGCKQTLKQRLQLDFQDMQMLSVTNRSRSAEEEKLKNEVVAIRNDIRLYRRKLKEINIKKAKLYGCILEIRKKLGNDRPTETNRLITCRFP